MKYAGEGASVGTNPGVQATNGKYDVFPILYPTKGSYATVSLAGAGAIKFKSKAPGKPTTSDPYGVKGTILLQHLVRRTCSTTRKTFSCLLYCKCVICYNGLRPDGANQGWFQCGLPQQQN